MRKIVICFVSFMMMISNILMVSAISKNKIDNDEGYLVLDNTVEIISTDKELEEYEAIEIAKMKEYFSNSEAFYDSGEVTSNAVSSLSSDSYTYDYRPIGDYIISNYSAYKVAYNQEPGGTAFNQFPAGLYWSDSTSSLGSYSISVTLAGKLFSVSLAYQPGKASETSGGVWAGISQAQVGKEVKMYVARKYKLQRYDVYRKPQYSGTWTYLSSYVVSTKYAKSISMRTV